MQSVDLFVALCAETDGRDKIYKAVGGLAKVLSSVPAVGPKAKSFATLSKAIGDGRSLMRMAKWTTNISKLNKFTPKALQAALSLKEVMEIFRIIGDLGYVVGDNTQYLAKTGIIAVNQKLAVQYSKVAQFYGFLFAVALDIYNFMLNAGKPDKQKEALVSLIKDIADLLACLAAVGYAKRFGYNPSGVFTGGCSLLSGSIATYTNWNKIVEKQKKAAIKKD